MVGKLHFLHVFISNVYFVFFAQPHGTIENLGPYVCCNSYSWVDVKSKYVLVMISLSYDYLMMFSITYRCQASILIDLS